MLCMNPRTGQFPPMSSSSLNFRLPNLASAAVSLPRRLFSPKLMAVTLIALLQQMPSQLRQPFDFFFAHPFFFFHPFVSRAAPYADSAASSFGSHSAFFSGRLSVQTAARCQEEMKATRNRAAALSRLD